MLGKSVAVLTLVVVTEHSGKYRRALQLTK